MKLDMNDKREQRTTQLYVKNNKIQKEDNKL